KHWEARTVSIFKKKPDQFTTYLVEFGKHLGEATDYFYSFKVKDAETLDEFATTMQQYETEADTKVHNIIKELNHVLITPIQREDIMELTIDLDVIMDGMEEFTALMDIHQMYSSDEYMDQFSNYIRKSSQEIVISLELLA